MKKPSLTHLIFKKHLLGDMYMSPLEKDELQGTSQERLKLH